jgi:hypothetical protein
MRLPFFDPQKDKAAAIATDLITRFGLRAHGEASYLAELSGQMRSRRNKALYELVVREIDASFLEAQRRLGLRRSVSDSARPGVLLLEEYEGGDHAHDGAERTADIPTSLVAALNLVDMSPSPRRRIGSR